MDFHLYLPLGDKGRAFPNSTHLGQAARFLGHCCRGSLPGQCCGAEWGPGAEPGPPVGPHCPDSTSPAQPDGPQSTSLAVDKQIPSGSQPPHLPTSTSPPQPSLEGHLRELLNAGRGRPWC